MNSVCSSIPPKMARYGRRPAKLRLTETRSIRKRNLSCTNRAILIALRDLTFTVGHHVTRTAPIGRQPTWLARGTIDRTGSHDTLALTVTAQVQLTFSRLGKKEDVH